MEDQEKPNSPFEYFFEFMMRKTEEDQSHMEPVERASLVLQATEISVRCAAHVYDSMDMWGHMCGDED